MSVIETIAIFAIGAVAGALLAFAFLRQRHAGWISLPTGTSLVLTVDTDGYGRFWEIKEMSPEGHVKMPGNKGMIKIDPQSGIWLGDAKVKLFLHYADYFRTIPPKMGAFFTHFKGRKGELEDEQLWDSIERQAENQPECGVVFDIRDVMYWATKISPAELLEGVRYAAQELYGELLMRFEGSKPLGGGILKWLLLGLLVAGGIFVFLMLFRR